LYSGRLVWGRREGRKNPHSDRRERRYRLREQAEWIEVDMPDLRIIDEALYEAVRAEIGRRQRPTATIPPARQNRHKHVLSGLIPCCCCGSNHTIGGKDYYRCAGQKERGTCGHTVSVRKEPLETATLAILQSHLLTEEHARLSIEEFGREAARLARTDEHRDEAAHTRLRQLKVDLAKLYQNLLAGLARPALQAMITEREAEKVRLEPTLCGIRRVAPTAEILTNPVLFVQFSRKVEALRASLDDEVIRAAASAVLATLIKSVTIYPDGEHGPEAEVVAKASAMTHLAPQTTTPPQRAAFVVLW